MEAQASFDAAPLIKLSANRMYFVDQHGKPVFWLGTTQWELFRGYSIDDARTIIEKSKATGFAFVQVKLLGGGDGTGTNIDGERPWIDNNPLTPNEAYFKHVDAVVEIAQKHGLVISMTVFHRKYKGITTSTARAWGKWIGARYRDVPGIVWAMTPVAEAESIPLLRELVAGLKENDRGGQHLITAKPDPSPYSSSFMRGESLLTFNSIQTHRQIELIYSMVTKDYQRDPSIPVLMAEGAYEQGPEYGFDVTPLWIRRQAYYSFLAGGHHAYGHNDSWRIRPTWKQALDAPGARQMGVLKKIFLERQEWWDLVPDQTVLASGSITHGRILTLAARHNTGKWIMVYWGGKKTGSICQRVTAMLAGKCSISVQMDKIKTAANIDAFWIDPRTGEQTFTGRFANTGVQRFWLPLGWEDAVLILEASKN